MITIGGKNYETKCISMGLDSHDMHFSAGKGARRRNPKTKIDLGVLHWTAGEGTAQTVFRVLSQRELGVEFTIDRAGKIWQHADPVLIDTFDAGPVNPRSWGVEVVSCGYVPAGKITDRTIRKGKINGEAYNVADFFPPQLDALAELCTVVCNALEMPTTAPKDEHGQAFTRTLSERELAAHQGLIGHYHITHRKVDPGPFVWNELAARGVKL